MEIILLEDVYNQGVAGDVVKVAPGYARNYLIPQGMAIRATEGALKEMEVLREQAAARRAEQEAQMQTLADKLKDIILYFPVRASEQGTLYGSVTNLQIAEAIMEQVDYDVDRRRIGGDSLRSLGEYDIPVRLGAGLSPEVKVIVYREGEEEPAVGEMGAVEDPEPTVDFAEMTDEQYAELAAAAGEDEIDAELVEEVLEAEVVKELIEEPDDAQEA